MMPSRRSLRNALACACLLLLFGAVLPLDGGPAPAWSAAAQQAQDGGDAGDQGPSGSEAPEDSEDLLIPSASFHGDATTRHAPADLRCTGRLFARRVTPPPDC